ncbi:carbohydrate ABC transporter permease [uncultured Clostridium sp.]|uniref:carbohydrate ABC transporter permease n=1 Tax=uncultured Clostridium sp. TaxID=59620 RepID=UPI00272BBB90|nr:sugar ABC transporter permease [uncultured Clostridium sp.]
MENLKVNKLKINKLKTNELNKAKINKLSKVNINKTYKSKIKNNKEKVRSKAKYTGLYFVLPSLIGVAVFTLLPFLDVFLRSFQSAISREFVGIENYIEVFNNSAFKLAASNTTKFVIVCIPLLLSLSLIIAVALNKFVESSKILRTAFLIPMAVPIASIVLIWNIVFHEQGFLSSVLDKFNIVGQDWMSTGWAFWILVFSYIWKNLGYNIILWLAGLNSISKEIYESAKVDGASDFQCFTKITIPCLKPTLYTISVLSLLNSFKVFREAYLVAGDYPDKSMYLLQHLFNNWFRELDFNKMAAGSILMAVIIFALIMLLQRAWEKQD